MLKQILIAATVGFLSLPYAYATPEDNYQGCMKHWMSSTNVADDEKVEYKDFGEKLCTCISKQPSDNKSELRKSFQICLSRTLLHIAMDNLNADVGLSEAKDSDISEACADEWRHGDSKQSEDEKKMGVNYCQCAQPKLVELLKQSDNMTEKQYDERLSTIADSCSDIIDFGTPAAN